MVDSHVVLRNAINDNNKQIANFIALLATGNISHHTTPYHTILNHIITYANVPLANLRTESIVPLNPFKSKVWGTNENVV